MGNGSYDTVSRAVRAQASGYHATHANDASVFVQAARRCVNEGMDPRQITIRECRDNPDHPATLPIVLALDVTGSMGRIPVDLIKNDLPKLMEQILVFCPDASVCFMAVGDEHCDQGPLQVGQFEASDELLDHWLTHSWLEGNGGGNGGESYSLPWLFAINKIQTDAWDKRGQKGILITVGDEPIHSIHRRSHLEKIFGDQFSAAVSGLEGTDISIKTVLEKARERWDVHHISLGSRRHGWEILGEQCHVITTEKEVVPEIVNIVRNHAPAVQESVAVGSGTLPAAPEIPAPL